MVKKKKFENSGINTAMWNILRQLKISKKNRSSIVVDKDKDKKYIYKNFAKIGKDVYERPLQRPVDEDEFPQINLDNAEPTYETSRFHPADSDTVILLTEFM